eukprot:363464-Chlamydomonas_euryale.AAC.5
MLDEDVSAVTVSHGECDTKPVASAGHKAGGWDVVGPARMADPVCESILDADKGCVHQHVLVESTEVDVTEVANGREEAEKGAQKAPHVPLLLTRQLRKVHNRD